MELQAFKGNDTLEARVTAALIDMLEVVDGVRDQFFDNAYTAQPLGDVLAATGEPIASAIPLEVFRASFPEIHQLYTRPGTFEFYLELFRKIWGESVTVEFTVSAPGKLKIEIDALSIQLNLALARVIEENVYVNYEIVDEDGDNLIFQGTQGLQTLRQAQSIINELCPAGIWREVVLSIS